MRGPQGRCRCHGHRLQDPAVQPPPPAEADGRTPQDRKQPGGMDSRQLVGPVGETGQRLCPCRVDVCGAHREPRAEIPDQVADTEQLIDVRDDARTVHDGSASVPQPTDVDELARRVDVGVRICEPADRATNRSGGVDGTSRCADHDVDGWQDSALLQRGRHGRRDDASHPPAFDDQSNLGAVVARGPVQARCDDSWHLGADDLALG